MPTSRRWLCSHLRGGKSPTMDKSSGETITICLACEDLFTRPTETSETISETQRIDLGAELLPRFRLLGGTESSWTNSDGKARSTSTRLDGHVPSSGCLSRQKSLPSSRYRNRARQEGITALGQHYCTHYFILQAHTGEWPDFGELPLIPGRLGSPVLFEPYTSSGMVSMLVTVW